MWSEQCVGERNDREEGGKVTAEGGRDSRGRTERWRERRSPELGS